MTLVNDLMTDVVETLREEDTLDRAAHLMRAGSIRHLPVVDDEEQLIGLVTHRGILSAWVSHSDPERERLANHIPVEGMMERNVLTVAPGTSAAVAAALLESSKFGCLPVVADGKLVGIITETDFVAFARKYFEAEESFSDPCASGACRTLRERHAGKRARPSSGAG
jgi:CBS domain-containing membrane protein